MGAADQGTEGSISSSRPDGSDVACVVPASGPIGTPKQLIIDAERRQLYCVSFRTPRHNECRRLAFEHVAAGQGDKQPDSAGVYRIDLNASPPAVVPQLLGQQGRGCGVCKRKP